MRKAIVIIPARFGSKRFPGKAIAPIAGLPLIVRVMQAAQKSKRVSDVFVATDDQRIADAIKQYGGKTFLSQKPHATGSDRAAELARTIDCDYVVDLQGDEPFLPAEIIDQVVQALDTPEVVMASACSPLKDMSDADNPNVVKVVLDKAGDALYFSRSRIPYLRADDGHATSLYRHIGIYGFRRDFLLKYASLERTPLEICESLEQLRALEHGYKIRVIIVQSEFVGIDSPEDIAKAEEILARQGK
ncbi:MAG TPA: 3-deoxy-manno-octulosonate cytidylyltransferase [candidate division Zixibacteria bacterium]|nr:3-deoxy-manno-octulosonate cytidylyltransferase [candidate division Zixibacteria bacterium]